MPLPDSTPARIMVVGAHPVDVFDNTGGTCAEHVAQGDSVTAVICTSGIHTHNERLIDELKKPEGQRDTQVIDEPPEAYAERKRQEAMSSLALFGVEDVVVLSYDDGMWDLNAGMIKDLTEVILDRKPHVMLQQNPGDGAALRDDHALIGVATHHAVVAAAQVRYGDTRACWHVLETYYYGVYGVNAHPFRSPNLPVDLFVDVTNHVEAKVRAHQFIESQGQHRGWGQKRIEAIEGHLGVFAGTSYAEAYVRAQPPVVETLPIDRHRFGNEKLSSSEQMRRNHQLTGAFVPEADGSSAETK